MAELTFRAVTPSRWTDMAQLFGERGACAGCWCMVWRLTAARWETGKGAGNRRAMRRIVASGGVPGVLAYRGRRPVGWCSVAPREQFSFLSRSRVLAPLDERPVWSVSCLFVDREFRRQGVSVALLGAAADFAARRGARIVEGYPTEPRGKLPDAFAWTGIPSAFLGAGFREVMRRSPVRPIMRKTVSRRRRS